MTSAIEAKLQAKETRQTTILSMLKDTPTVLMVKTNLPGQKTHSTEAKLLMRQFNHLLTSLFHRVGIAHESADGNYLLFPLKREANALKKLTILIEDHHPLGRLIDLDVHTEDGPLMRTTFGAEERRCFLCHHAATYCRREGTHTEAELSAYIEKHIQDYFITALKNASIDALRKELFTYPCFGLVSAKNNGVHTDMNISFFLSALTVLNDAFDAYLRLGLDAPIGVNQLRKLGGEYEAKLLKHCRGVNTHKGAHFIFGLILPHMVAALFNDQSFETMMANRKKDAAAIATSDFATLKTATTYGEKAYQNHQIKGVRGELENGLPSIFDWYPQKPMSPLKKLVKIMARLDDTTLMKNGKDTLKDVQACMRNLEQTDFASLDTVQDCLKGTVSPGGAADLLALTFYFEQTDHLFAKTP